MAEKKFLDQNGLLYVWTKIKNLLGGKVDKVEGKGLSTNDLTDELKQKILDAGSSSFSGAYSDLTGKPKINGVELGVENSLSTLGIQGTEEGKGLSTNDYTTEEKNKLAGIATGAQVNTIEGVKVNGKSVTPVDKIVSISTATKTSELTNDSKFQTESEVTSKVNGAVADKVSTSQMNTAISNATNGMATQSWVNTQLANINKKEVVTSISQMTDTNTIYLIANAGEQDNVYDEYIVVNGTPEKVGTTQVDLTNYVQDSDLVAITNTEIDTIFTK